MKVPGIQNRRGTQTPHFRRPIYELGQRTFQVELNELFPDHIDNYFALSTEYDFYSGKQNVLPYTYLEHAKNDRSEGDDARGLINAVGNAKRAFHLQVEMLCDAFGWAAVFGRKQANFGVRLDFLAKCGVVSPNILRKLNTTRNKVEHDYVVPDPVQVDDYIDIVELFLMATKDLLDRFPKRIEYELMKDECYDESLDLPEFVAIEITMISGGIKLEARNATLSLALNDPKYFDWLSAVIRHYVL